MNSERSNALLYCGIAAIAIAATGTFFVSSPHPQKLPPEVQNVEGSFYKDEVNNLCFVYSKPLLISVSCTPQIEKLASKVVINSK
jgi:hypothetical protein